MTDNGLIRGLAGLLVIISGILLFMAPFHIFASDPIHDNGVIATVNATPIHKAELYRLIMEYQRQTGKRQVTPEDKKKLLENLVTRQLILQQPEIQLLRNDPAIKSEVSRYEENLIVGRYVRDRVQANVNLTNAEMRGYYDQHQDQFSVSPKIEASVILLKTREAADQALQQVQQGADFAELAKATSIDLPSAEKGGSIGVVERGTVYPEIWRVLIQLSEGQTSGIIETKYGYNIVKVNKVVSPESIKPFDEVKEEIRRKLLPQKREDVYDEMAAQLKDGANIEIFNDRL
jgi:peptidyl-prolyl cis-trans isomerase C